MDELSRDISTRGVINPITVYKSRGKYQLISGRARLEASIICAKTTIPALVMDVPVNEQVGIHIAENIMRGQLSPIEEGYYYYKVLEYTCWTIQELAKYISKSDDYVKDRLSIQNWPESLREAVDQNYISFSAGKELSQIINPQLKESYIQLAKQGGISQRLATQWRISANQMGDQITPQQIQETVQGAPRTTGEIQQPCYLCSNQYPVQQTTLIRMCDTCKRVFDRTLQEPENTK